MESPTAADHDHGPNATGGTQPNVSGLLADARSLWREVTSLAHDHIALAALEARLAGRSLVVMVVAGVLVAVLLVSAWLGLLGAAVLWLVSAGLPASGALLLAVAANLVLVVILWAVIHRQSRNLQFPRSVRSLQPGSPHERMENSHLETS